MKITSLREKPFFPDNQLMTIGSGKLPFRARGGGYRGHILGGGVENSKRRKVILLFGTGI